MTKKLVMVETLHQFRMRYVVEIKDNIDDALDEVILHECEGPDKFKEFSQYPLEPSVILSHREIDEEDYLRIFDIDNDYLKNWTKEQKLNFINKINYDKEETNE